MGFPIPSNVIEIDFFMYLIDHKVNIRPEDFSLQKDSEFTDDTYLKTTIEVIEPLGNETFLYFNVNGMQYVARVDSDTKSKVGDLITLTSIQIKFISLIIRGKDLFEDIEY